MNSGYVCIVFTFLISLNEISCSNYSVTEISGIIIMDTLFTPLPDSESSENESKVYKARIEGGDITDINKYPYNVFIFTKYKDGSGLGEACSGSIIGIKWILTAGHCKVDSIPSKQMKVYAGSANCLRGTKHEVKNAIRHPLFSKHYNSDNSIYFHHDYMVLELKKKLVYGLKIAKIIIGTNEDIVNGSVGVITGYGPQYQIICSTSTSTMMLREAKVDITKRESCIGWIPHIAVCEFCAGRFGIDLCSGDSGGPIVSDTPGFRRLLGVAAYDLVGPGDVCISPGVYSSVPYVKNWILGITGEL